MSEGKARPETQKTAIDEIKNRKKTSFADSIMRAQYHHMNTDITTDRVERLEIVVGHLIFCLEEIQKNGKRLSEC